VARRLPGRDALELVEPVLAFHQLHHEKEPTSVFAEAVECRDPGMVQLREELPLALEAPDAFDALGILREGLREDLDGDIAPELRVPRPVDFALPPAPRSERSSNSLRRVPAGRAMATHETSSIIRRDYDDATLDAT